MKDEKGIEYIKVPKVGELYRSASMLDKRIWEVRHVTGDTPGFPVTLSDTIVTLERKGRSVPNGAESLTLPLPVPNGAEYLTLPLPVLLSDFKEVPEIEIQKS